MKTNVMHAAIEYAENLRWSVIPLAPNSKVPPKDFSVLPFRERIASRAEIEGWWRKDPRYNIGIITGRLSRILGVDHDRYKPGYSEAEALRYIPDDIITPTSETAHGGQHQLFTFPEEDISIGVELIPGLDYRGEGGYIVAPPSVGDNGKGYKWIIGPGEVEPASLPGALLSAIINNKVHYRGGVDNSVDGDEFFSEGRRDNDLFHTANILVKGGMPDNEIRQVLKRLIISWGESPDPKWIDAKITSALKRAERRDRTLAADVRDWVLSTSGIFLSTEIYSCLQVSTRDDKKNVSIILKRMCDEGEIERSGNKNGCFRRVETDIEPVNFLTAPTDEFPITWPMEIHEQCVIYPGNIIMVAGSKDAGKTAFLLNTAKMNMTQHEIVYLNSEMGDTEFRKRLEFFEDVSLSEWKLRAYHRASNFADLITPEKKIFIVDFLEVTTDFWKVAGMIQEIHKKLKEGICIIALQKADGRDVGRGGDFSKEKARLYLSLDYLRDQKVNQIKITNAKSWRTDRNPRGMYRTYKLVNGSRFIPQSYWRD